MKIQEWIMTYGWVVLIILLVTGGLVYYYSFYTPPVTTNTLNCTQPQQYLNDYYNSTQQNNSVQVYVQCKKESHSYGLGNSAMGCRCYLLRDFQNWTIVINDEFWRMKT